MKTLIQSINIELTRKCNLNCPYCYVKYRKNCDFIHEELSLNENLISIKNSEIPTICLTGGEPLLYPDFNNIVDLYQDKYIILLTNGVICADKNHNIDEVTISLDGKENVMFLQRNVPNGLYHSIRQNIHNYINQYDTVNINTVITKQNVYEYHKMDLQKEFYSKCNYRLASIVDNTGKLELNQDEYNQILLITKNVYEKYNYAIRLTHDIVNKRTFMNSYSKEVPIMFPPEFIIEDNIFRFFTFQYGTLEKLINNYFYCCCHQTEMIIDFLKYKNEDFLFSPYALCDKLTYNK